MATVALQDVTVTLRDWFEANVEGWRDVEVRPHDVELGAGFSAEIFFVDVTYVDRDGPQARTLVVRRQPTDFEVVLGSSLALQGKMMAALDAWGGVPVPPWIGMELDTSVLGLPFLVMGKVDGQCATQRPNYNVDGWLKDMEPAGRARSFRNAIHAFANLSKIDWEQGFDFLARNEWGKPGVDQYVGHLVAWHAGCAKGRSMRYIDAALDHIQRHKPLHAPVNVLWGDATPSNVMFDASGEVQALIDWELAALGPAELDLAWWLYFDDLFSRRFGIERLPGLPTRDETIAIWEAAVGRKAENLEYYDVVVALRMALVAVGAFDRQVSVGNIKADNKSIDANLMTLYLAERLGMEPPEFGPDFYAFMSNLTPVEEK
ncbi:phosphotransferase family protein [Sphingomonas sp. KC8]|uniref:phosphotransferase family protein n=1 Tax=Sphingomonas sp. KC8 TaxID=1030157 RepID=UPI000248AB45|nr:phosphotransferase family protein [Sphingomonas sp. KC8]ARS26842.1 phosphotransferase [Sphingomonas sp. KC8]